MILKFKNKNLMALDKMIQQGKDAGGIPSRIELYPDEAFALLNEINRLHQEGDIPELKVEQRELSEIDIRLPLYNKDGMSQYVAIKVIEKWFKKEYMLKYKDVELHVVNKPKKPELTQNESTTWKWPWNKK